MSAAYNHALYLEPRARIDAGLGVFSGTHSAWGQGTRLILCFHQKTLVVLHGFIKKTQKTPAEELDWAKWRLKEIYTMTKRNKHIGSSLDDFLKEEGILEETRAIALKDAVAWQVQQAMEQEKITELKWHGACTRAALL